MITVRHAVAACALVAGLCGGAGAQAPAGWTLVVRIVPNPVPFGRCASVSVEPQDADGYRTSTLSNGQTLDFRAFTYDADTTNFQWKNGNPLEGSLCPRPPGTPSTVTVTVTLPDGLSGSAVLKSMAPGTLAAPAQYAPQAPLRGHGVPVRRSGLVATAASAPGPAASATTAGSTPGPSAAPAAAAAGGGPPVKAMNAAATSPLGKAGQTAGTFQPQSITAGPLQMTGPVFAAAPLAVDAAPLQMTGPAAAIAPMDVDAQPLHMIGAGGAFAAIVVTAPPLGMTGAGFAAKPQSIDAARLTMTGTAP